MPKQLKKHIKYFWSLRRRQHSKLLKDRLIQLRKSKKNIKPKNWDPWKMLPVVLKVQ